MSRSKRSPRRQPEASRRPEGRRPHEPVTVRAFHHRLPRGTACILGPRRRSGPCAEGFPGAWRTMPRTPRRPVPLAFLPGAWPRGPRRLHGSRSGGAAPVACQPREDSPITTASIRRSAPSRPLLAQGSRPHLDVLNAGRARGAFFAFFEVAGVTLPPDVAIGRLARALCDLPPSVRRLWKQARDRVFDIGLEGTAGRDAFPPVLRRDTVKTIARLNARVGLTVYSHARRQRRKPPNKPVERASSTGRSAPSR